MTDQISRREAIERGTALLALAGLGKWTVLQQGDELVPWTDIPANFNPNTALDTRALKRDQFLTPIESFYLVQHYGQFQLDPATYKLKVTGLIDKPLELTLDELKRRKRVEEIVGFECGGSSPASLNRLTGNARWAGTPLRDLLNEVGLRPDSREIVFFGGDKGMETVTHGRATQQVEQHFGRSLAREDALRPEVMIVWEMNGAPLPPNHGAPVRLVVPGWYGVANVKWMNRIHVQDTRYVGRFMGRDYVTLNTETSGEEPIWNETSVARIRVKSMVARLTRSGSRYTALGFALANALPLKSIEVKVDDGPWRKATLDSQNTRYSWQMFSYQFDGVGPGEHTIVSRAVDANGVMQPEQSTLDQKKTNWENNGQFVRKFSV